MKRRQGSSKTIETHINHFQTNTENMKQICKKIKHNYKKWIMKIMDSDEYEWGSEQQLD